jgi:hypothetical protein
MKTNDVLAGLLGVLVGAFLTFSLRGKASVQENRRVCVPVKRGNLIVWATR